MTSKRWKAVEREIAAKFGTRRTPLSGINSGHTSSDTLHPKLYIEIKHGAGCPTTWKAIKKLMLETERKTEKENKCAIVVLHRKGSADFTAYMAFDQSSLVMAMDLKDLAKLFMPSTTQGPGPWTAYGQGPWGGSTCP